MSWPDGSPDNSKMERLLAGLLYYGSWLASAAIGVGLVLALTGARFGTHALPGMQIATIGIALFILLPSLRVALMLVVFWAQRDYRLAMIALLVLTIILLGFLLGIRTPSSGADIAVPGSRIKIVMAECLVRPTFARR